MANYIFSTGNRYPIILNETLRSTRGALGGSESYLLLKALSDFYPDNIYFVTSYIRVPKKYDIDKDFQNKNVVFLANNILKKYPEHKEYKDKLSDSSRKIIEDMYQILNKENIKGAILTHSIDSIAPPGLKLKLNGEPMKLLFQDYVSLKYLTPLMIEALNIDYIVLTIDNRYSFGKQQYCSVIPKVVFSISRDPIFIQYNEHKEYKRTFSLKTCKKDLLYPYLGMEYSTISNLPNINNNYKKYTKKKVFIAFNQNKDQVDKYNRLFRLSELGLSDNFNDSDIDIFSNYYQDKLSVPEDCKKFNIHEPLPQQDIFNLTDKYFASLILPHDNTTVITPKFWEVLYQGAIPFILWDGQARIMDEKYIENKHIPRFLIVNNCKELKEKIDFLLNNEEELDNLINKLNELFDEDVISGKYLADLAINSFK